MAHLCSSSPDTKSVDVGSMFLIDLSVEESCDLDEDAPAPASPEDEHDSTTDNINQVEDDDFRELRQQPPPLVQQQPQQHQVKIKSSASKTIATSTNSHKHQHQLSAGEEDEDEEDAASSIMSSFDANTSSDIQMPPSNAAVSYLSDHDFLEQEYNDNHHNHYSTDESDDEPLSAEDNPMKLFESIQALARSLHEDAELFGSLPPKRTLESPIRSLLLT